MAGMVAAGAGCAPRPAVERLEYTQIHMGVETRIVVWAEPGRAVRTAIEAAFHRIATLDSLLSDYRLDSDLARVNAAAGGAPARASPDLTAVVLVALDVARASGGAFDPTVGPLTRLWRAAQRTGTTPDAEAMRNAAELADWEAVHVDVQAMTIALPRPGMALDLGGIGKGYVIDAAIDVLAAHGVRTALVQMGGDLAVIGSPPDEAGWRVLLPDHADTVQLTAGALSVSGGSEQFIELAGRRFSHVLDPPTGIGVSHDAFTLVTAPTAVLSDALATAAGLLDEAGRARLARAYAEATITVRLP